MKPRILVVDDEPSICASLSELLSSKGYEVVTVEDATSCLELLRGKRGFNCVLLDVQLPDMNGLDALEKLKQRSPELPVIMITGQGSVPQSVEAMQKGALDYVMKPFNVNELLARIQNAIDTQDLKEQVGLLKKQVTADWDKQYVVGPNRSMQQVFDRVELVARSDSTTVFIHGETGTGKEVIARKIHQMSARQNRPFVEVNATALTAELLESELFGHEEGSFTGASGTKKGLFEVASGGTLFLDEIGDMDLLMQAKILRAIQERKIRRVGGTEQIEVDIRLITASNRNLDQAVKEGTFREDLYYRLNVVPIVLPPLRERRDDIETLLRHYIDIFNKEFGKQVTDISTDALEALENYAWPGNVRELRNLLERTMLLETHGSTLELSHLKFGVGIVSRPIEGGSSPVAEGILGSKVPLEEVEKQHIARVLESTKGNKNQAAIILGIDRTTLYNKLKKYQIQVG